MKPIYENFLFTKHILVSDGSVAPSVTSFPALIALGQKFGIRINKHPELAVMNMIRVAEFNLGEYVPEPFYRGFPDSVRELTPDQLLYDQLLHYTQTYGCGWFDRAGHSTMEESFERIAYNEDVPPKEFDILPESEAMTKLTEYLRDLLGSNRPLNYNQIDLVQEGWKDFGKDILPEWMPCKDTVIRFIYDFRDMTFCRYLKLSDTIKLLNYIQYNEYGSENLKKLNLKNQDRKLITAVIDWFFDSHSRMKIPYDSINIRECHEKKKIWCGLLHHIHYHGKTDLAIFFVNGIRGDDNMSYLSEFEGQMNNGNPVQAAKLLKRFKGSSAVLRNMNYILSRCKTDEEIEEVFSCLE